MRTREFCFHRLMVKNSTYMGKYIDPYTHTRPHVGGDLLSIANILMMKTGVHQES